MTAPPAPAAFSEETFEAHRPLLFGVAYRMLGSASEAEDMVQETYLRAAGAGESALRSPAGYLVTIATRLCLDQLKSARRQRETYVGPWLPEPLPTAAFAHLRADRLIQISAKAGSLTPSNAISASARDPEIDPG